MTEKLSLFNLNKRVKAVEEKIKGMPLQEARQQPAVSLYDVALAFGVFIAVFTPFLMKALGVF